MYIIFKVKLHGKLLAIYETTLAKYSTLKRAYFYNIITHFQN